MDDQVISFTLIVINRLWGSINTNDAGLRQINNAVGTLGILANDITSSLIYNIH